MTRTTRIVALSLALALGGCAGVTVRPPQQGNSQGGKCQGPDYNAPTCIYQF